MTRARWSTHPMTKLTRSKWTRSATLRSPALRSFVSTSRGKLGMWLSMARLVSTAPVSWHLQLAKSLGVIYAPGVWLVTGGEKISPKSLSATESCTNKNLQFVRIRWFYNRLLCSRFDSKYVAVDSRRELSMVPCLSLPLSCLQRPNPPRITSLPGQYALVMAIAR